MPRLDDMATQAQIDEAQRRYLFAPRGQRLARLRELQDVVLADLKRGITVNKRMKKRGSRHGR